MNEYLGSQSPPRFLVAVGAGIGTRFVFGA